jgi:hypothetical protein
MSQYTPKYKNKIKIFLKRKYWDIPSIWWPSQRNNFKCFYSVLWSGYYFGNIISLTVSLFHKTGLPSLSTSFMKNSTIQRACRRRESSQHEERGCSDYREWHGEKLLSWRYQNDLNKWNAGSGLRNIQKEYFGFQLIINFVWGFFGFFCFVLFFESESYCVAQVGLELAM